MKIIDYKIAAASYVEAVLLKEGWQPFGSPFVGDDEVESQAVVKYEEKEVFLAGMPCPPIKIKSDGEEEDITERIENLLKQNGELEFRLSELAKESYKAINEVQQLKKENEKLNSELIKLTEENRILNENNC